MLGFLASTPRVAQAQAGSEEIYFYHLDHLGAPVRMTNSSGAVVWRWQYGPFGEEPLTMEPNTINQNLRFPGQYYDAETGLNYNIYRYYFSSLGMYIQPDPICVGNNQLEIEIIGSISFSRKQLIIEPQRQNSYVFVTNNPSNFSDPLGLCKSGACEDCPRGNWFGSSFSAGGEFIKGASISIQSVTCGAKNGLSCTIIYSCKSKGIAFSIGVSIGPVNCFGMKCKEDVGNSNTGYGITIGPLGLPVPGGGKSGCDGPSIGGGKGGFGIGISKNTCEPIYNSCR